MLSRSRLGGRLNYYNRTDREQLTGCYLSGTANQASRLHAQHQVGNLNCDERVWGGI